MCIIAIKPAGVNMPSADILTNMWVNNPDGAGFMYSHKGRVYIEKGFMKKSELDTRLAEIGRCIDLKETPLVLHFRITTHGGTCASNCHPFPISDNTAVLQKLSWVSDIGVAHNGVIPITPRKNISDTMEYIVSQLVYIKRSNRKFYKSNNIMRLIENATHSKLAFLADDYEVYTIGDFVEHNGMKFSNTSYMPRISYSYYDTDTLPWYQYTYQKKRNRSESNVYPLMCLNDNFTGDLYARMSNGEIGDVSMLAVNSKGDLYQLDPDSGCAYRDRTSCVVGTVRFDESKAENYVCYRTINDLLRDWYGAY